MGSRVKVESTGAIEHRRADGVVAALTSVVPYRRLWYAGIGYYSAYWVEIVSTGWVVLNMTGSAFYVGSLVSAARSPCSCSG